MALKDISKRTLQSLSEGHGPFDRVLDVGCGGGIYRRFVNTNQYVGIDVEESGHNDEDKKVDRFFDGEHIPFGDGEFDLVMCTEVLEHALEPEKLTLEMKRVLKPGGVLFLTVPSMWGEHETPYDFRRYTTFGIRRLVETAGMELVSLQKEDPGTASFIKLGLSEVRNGTKNRKIARILARYWLLATSILFRRILAVEMERIYLSNVAAIRKP